jgi:hypothetical protein
LTLLPMLATAAVAAADPVGPDPWPQISPPGMTEPTLSPPGMTPTADECQSLQDDIRCDPQYFVDPCDPDLDDPDDPDCYPYTYVSGGVVYGGFGRYFWASHG